MYLTGGRPTIPEQYVTKDTDIGMRERKREDEEWGAICNASFVLSSWLHQ